jgi:hypothetical protein
MEKRNIYKILVGKPKGKRPLGRPRFGWRIIVKWFTEICSGVAWAGLIWLRI